MLVRVPRIDRRAVEKLRTVDEVRRDSIARQVCGAHRERIGAAVYGNSYILQAEHRLRARMRASHGSIERHEGADLVAELRQLAHQRPDHIRETAGLGERHHLGTQYANFERRHQASLAKAICAARRSPSQKTGRRENLVRCSAHCGRLRADTKKHAMRHAARSNTGRYVSRLTSGTLAVVMAGGRGERLKALTLNRCKPATPFGG